MISRHLDSLADANKRKTLTTLFAGGVSDFESKVPIIKGWGKAVVISDPNNLYFLMSLNSREYPFEKIGVFRNDISLPFISPGQRSLLGAFLADNPKILSEDLFGGSLSLRWVNRIADNSTKLKMKVTGKKKINGQEVHIVEVSVPGIDPSKFRARLFFDTATFRHVRSEYHREVEIGRIVVRQQNELQNAVADLVEDFSDFKEVSGWTLPHRYKITFTSNSGNQIYETSWGFKVANFYFDQKLAPDFFTFDVK